MSLPRSIRKLVLSAGLGGLALIGMPSKAHAFCGFYVGRAGAELFNKASQVAIARDGDKTILTLSNDFEGNLTEFAMVIPVPTVLRKEQIHIGDKRYLDRIDSYSAPRLAEYHDPNPCQMRVMEERAMAAPSMAKSAGAPARSAARDEALGVKVEAEYSVGEYDIVLLSATQSDGLETWLKEQGYAMPARASAALAPYVRQNMKFFVAKVNLEAQAKAGFRYLRPIQIAYQSPKFMLPIRLGMANARGPQDLVVYMLTRKGRVESANYKTVKVPADQEIPRFVRSDFGRFYAAAFEKAWKKEGQRAVFTEYMWQSSNCDPCADQPMNADELKGLGVFWLDQPDDGSGAMAPGMAPSPMRRPPGRWGGNFGGNQPFVTRLHVRYDGEHFPEDLVFQETGDTQNFQARYVLRNPATGDLSCPEGQRYVAALDERHRKQAQTLVELTDWQLDDVYKRMGSDAPRKNGGEGDDSWFKSIWK